MKREYPTPNSAADHLLEAKSLQDDFVGGQLSCAIEQGIGLHPDIQIKDKVLCLGEDEIRESGIPYTIVRPCALTEEPAGANLIFDQGDNIHGEDIPCRGCSNICGSSESPYACDNTFEVMFVLYNMTNMCLFLMFPYSLQSYICLTRNTSRIKSIYDIKDNCEE
ncbi:hypothetical protein CQW23_28233 [Capsicum baccatum]|uniref:NAD(P)-binding domain-containing protein n=1 Tax=Capsicum baccatum TaxID=33114 RepID=A0A2G2VFZ2_CAPBA|nr:hypothetical protein CQW23_28233 [Capsicum baccatum]